MDSPPILRRLTSGDAPALCDYYERLSLASKRTFAPFGQYPRLEQYEDVVRGNDPQNGDKFDLVTVAGAEIVGWSFVWGLNAAEPVFGIGVADAYHGRGVGTALMDGVLAAMRERGIPMLYLTVVTDNERAWAMYSRRGFKRYGRFTGEDGLPYYRMVADLQSNKADNAHSQETNLMQWHNEPPAWQQTGTTLNVTTGPKTDFWRKTHYGFIRDSGHFYGQTVSGNFVAEVKVSGNYHDLYDHAGLMVRLDESTWIKCGIEFFEGMQHVSAVVTRDYSDWSIIPAPHNPPALWLRLKRMGDAVEISYSFDGEKYMLLRLAHLTQADTLSVGPMCASPEGNGFTVTFNGFTVQAVP